MNHILTVDATSHILPKISGQSDGQWRNIKITPISLCTLEEEIKWYISGRRWQNEKAASLSLFPWKLGSKSPKLQPEYEAVPSWWDKMLFGPSHFWKERGISLTCLGTLHQLQRSRSDKRIKARISFLLTEYKHVELMTFNNYTRISHPPPVLVLCQLMFLQHMQSGQVAEHNFWLQTVCCRSCEVMSQQNIKNFFVLNC